MNKADDTKVRIRYTRRRTLLATVALGVGAIGRGHSAGLAGFTSSFQIGQSEQQVGLLNSQIERVVEIVDGFRHEQYDDEKQVLHVLEYFEVEELVGRERCEQNLAIYISRASSLASQAREEGISNELAALGVPEFEEILQLWEALLTP